MTETAAALEDKLVETMRRTGDITALASVRVPIRTNPPRPDLIKTAEIVIAETLAKEHPGRHYEIVVTDKVFDSPWTQVIPV